MQFWLCLPRQGSLWLLPPVALLFRGMVKWVHCAHLCLEHLCQADTLPLELISALNSSKTCWAAIANSTQLESGEWSALINFSVTLSKTKNKKTQTTTTTKKQQKQLLIVMAPGAGLIGLWGAGSNVLEMPSRVNRIQQLLSDCLSLSAGLPASREEMRPETPLGERERDREGGREREKERDVCLSVCLSLYVCVCVCVCRATFLPAWVTLMLSETTIRSK